MRRGFTLLELLVIVSIIGVMIASAIVSVGASRSAFRMRGAVQRVMLLTRQARTMALLKQTSAVITFGETEREDASEFTGSRIEVSSSPAAGASGTADLGVPRTIAGDYVEQEDDESEATGTALMTVSKSGTKTTKDTATDTAEADEMTDPLDKIVDRSSFAGLHLKVEFDDEEETVNRGKYHSRISVFSTASAVKSRIVRAETKKSDEAEDEASEKDADGKSVVAVQEDVEVVYEPNGHCRPYRVTVWKDGYDEDTGMTVEVDRFGKTKVADKDAKTSYRWRRK